jgi:hypothetical protein
LGHSIQQKAAGFRQNKKGTDVLPPVPLFLQFSPAPADFDIAALPD